jgi:GntR family transcriptional regulator/MocR family aminotransferase
MGCDAMGYYPLRESVAEYLTTSRGVRCCAQQIAIVSGIQEALDITSRLLIQPGDMVCMEDPGYTGAAAVFAASQARLRFTPVDEQGIMVHRLPRSGVRIAYVTPGHQFPLGVTMSLARRGSLIAWAQTSRALIFEDDYDCEYRYAGRPVPALQGLAPPGMVLYAGTFSKTLFPGLRLGYMVVPDGLEDRVEAMKSVTTRHAPTLDQVALHTFIREGHFARHVRQMRAVYAERLGTLLSYAEAKLSGALTITGIEAGLQTAGTLADGLDSIRIATIAAELGVEVTPLSRYAKRKLAYEGLQLGFAAVTPKEIRRGVDALAKAVEPSK